MGKGEIQSHIGSGKYNVKLAYAYRARITAKLDKLQKEIDAIDVKIAAETDPAKLAILKLQKASMQRRYDYYSTGMPEDPTIEAWCADLTEDLSGNVGTIEIPGEPAQIIIRPGYNSRATYSQSRDGQLMPAIAGEPNQVLFNWMLLPGWQRHMPVYRVGTIAEIDYSANTATVCLDPAFSSQQYLPAVDDIGVSDCEADDPVESQINSFCSRYPTHPLCTTTDQGGEINLTDKQLADLQTVNRNINRSFGREQDKSGYGIGDSWDVMGGSITRGDCEDFALTKYQKLVDDYGWNPASLKIVTAWEPVTGQYHAMLAVRTSNKGLVVLDVNNDNLMLNGRTPYRIHRIALTKDEWVSYSRQLSGVAVEYMTCNAGAFVTGDRVIVEFSDQKYTSAKVIGFEEKPAECTTRLFSFFGAREGAMNYNVSTMLNVVTESSYDLGDIRLDYFHRWYPGAARIGPSAYLVGGWAPQTSVNFGQYTQSFRLLSLNTRFTPLGTSGHYTDRTAMPAPARADVAAFAIGMRAYAIGGGVFRTSSLAPSDTTYRDNDSYDPVADSWTTREDCPISRGGAMGFGLDGRAHVIGGWTGTKNSPLGGAWQKNVGGGHHAYSPETDAWLAKTELSVDRSNGQNFSLDGYGYVFGGDDDGSDIGTHYSSRNERYNHLADTWSLLSLGTTDFGDRPGLAGGGKGYLFRGSLQFAFMYFDPIALTLAHYGGDDMEWPDRFLARAGGVIA